MGFAVVIIVLRFGFRLGNGDSIYLATGLAVLLYTVETSRMRREMVRQREEMARQNEIAIQPLLIVTIAKVELGVSATPGYGFGLVLRNIGRGPALSFA